MTSDELFEAIFGRIAGALEKLAEEQHKANVIEQARFDKEYPPKKEVQDVTITHIKTEEERLREDQGDTGESDEEWIGAREQRFEEEQRKRRTAAALRKAARGSR